MGSFLDLVPREAAPHLTPPVDLRGLALDGQEAIRRSGGARFVIEMPLADCRGHKWLAFPCVPGAGHPMVETARILLERPEAAYEDTPLFDFYGHYRPRTAADLLGIAGDHPDLGRHPSAATFPWARPPVADEEARSRSHVAAEMRAHGLDFGAEEGFAHFGPTSSRRGAVELARLKRVVASIGARGFRLGSGRDGLCSGHLLVHGQRRVALIENGQHRIAALGALGHEFAPLWLLPHPVRRDEAGDWPGVRAGVFTRDEALAVFDRVLDGRQPVAGRAPGAALSVVARMKLAMGDQNGLMAIGMAAMA